MTRLCTAHKTKAPSLPRRRKLWDGQEKGFEPLCGTAQETREEQVTGR